MQHKFLGLLMCLCASFAISAPDEDLEKMLDAGRYREFFESVQHKARRGDTEAIFLLGKAYHLGRGTEPDLVRARHLYEIAAKQNSAKAENNLGMMDLDRDDDLSALDHFNRALELGLKLPTLNNIGTARMKICYRSILYQDAAPCILAGDSFLQAWRVSRKNSALDEAVAAYVRACIVNRQSTHRSVATSQPESAPGCKQAIEWSEKGAELRLSRATYNRGAIEYNTGRHTEALPWFHRANALGLGLAAYTIGDMYEKGLGVPEDAVTALQWFRRGAELKDEQSTSRMRIYWSNKMSASYDVRRIKEAMAEWDKLTPSQAYPFEALYKLKLIETLAQNKLAFPDLAKESMPTTLCPRDEMLYEKTSWTLFALTKPEDAGELPEYLPQLAKGLIDSKGCARLPGKVQSELQKALSEGATLMFGWPGQRYLISVVRRPHRPLEFQLGLKVVY